MKRKIWSVIAIVMIVSTVLVACKKESPTPETVSPLASPLSLLPTPVPVDSQPSGMIAFHSTRSIGHQIFVMDGDGSHVRQVTDFAPPNSEPAWSLDGSKIAFTSGKDDISNFTLYVINQDGTNAHRILEPGRGDNWYPTWSPQGDQIAFQSNRDGNFEIYKVVVETGEATRLTHNESTDSMPAWSPDGTKIAFVSNESGDGEIYTMNTDGTDRVRLTHNPGEDTQPDWSPDGSKILFMSGRDNNGEIYVMNSDGSQQVRLTFTEMDAEWRPRWAVHGTKILFSATYEADWEIYMMDTDGSNVVRLTNQPGEDRGATWLDLD